MGLRDGAGVGLHGMAGDTLPMQLFDPGGIKRLAELEPVDRQKAEAIAVTRTSL